MKLFLRLMLAAMLAISMLSGCRQAAGDDKINIVCTTFPQYDWVRQIVGDKTGDIEISLLLDSKIDLHSYQPSVDDIAKISACDLFIYVGGESDEWVHDALGEAANQNMATLNLLEELGSAAKAEELKEGMEEEEHGHEEDEHEEHEAGYDEHIWLSLKNAKTLCAAIEGAISSLDAGNAEVYKSNLKSYIEQLSALDLKYQATVDAAPTDTLLFGDRFPFRYLVDDYGLDYHAAFVGCSAETEASFDTVIFLAGKTDELRLKNIMVTESSNQSIAKTIRDNTAGKNQQILVLDAMQSVSSDDVANGAAYLSIMESNLDVLKEALQ